MCTSVLSLICGEAEQDEEESDNKSTEEEDNLKSPTTGKTNKTRGDVNNWFKKGDNLNAGKIGENLNAGKRGENENVDTSNCAHRSIEFNASLLCE